MDTVTLVRFAIGQLLNVVESELEAELRGVLGATTTPAAGNPSRYWDDRLPVKPWSTKWRRCSTRRGSPRRLLAPKRRPGWR